nr:uncharacterized protein LOC110375534 [Helicoverpa armigera]XP_049707954.1 uncharacterized protein LOC126056981 [Helicoverpa armigera]
MLLNTISIILLYYSLNNVHGVFDDVHYTLFGNLASTPDLLNDTEGDLDNTTTDDYDTPDELDMEFPNVFTFRQTNLTEAFDIQDYNLVNEQFTNSSKQIRNQTRRFSYYDKDDKKYKEKIESYKKGLLVNILVQFVMHARYEVGKALTQRDKVRDDKRYKLGYLFNRLRRLKTDQLKMVGTAWYQNRTSHRSLFSLMRFYERVVHFDVDIRDTCNLVKKVFSVVAPYDIFDDKKKKKKNKKT